MNPIIIRKCLEELGKDNPKLDYVRGMLEALLALSFTEETQRPQMEKNIQLVKTAVEKDPEAAALEAKVTPQALAEMQKMIA